MARGPSGAISWERRWKNPSEFSATHAENAEKIFSVVSAISAVMVTDEARGLFTPPAGAGRLGGDDRDLPAPRRISLLDCQCRPGRAFCARRRLDTRRSGVARHRKGDPLPPADPQV